VGRCAAPRTRDLVVDFACGDDVAAAVEVDLDTPVHVRLVQLTELVGERVGGGPVSLERRPAVLVPIGTADHDQHGCSIPRKGVLPTNINYITK